MIVSSNNSGLHFILLWSAYNFTAIKLCLKNKENVVWLVFFPIENVIFVCCPYLDEDLAVVLVDNRHDMLILNPTTYWTLANCQMSTVLFKLRHKSENFFRFW